MLDFTFHPKTKIFFGKTSLSQLPTAVTETSTQGVLLHYGQGSAVKSGLIDRTKGLLDEAGIRYIELSGVQPNPRLSLVREGIALCKAHNLGLVLAIGGGSVIDSAKAIGVGGVDDGDVWDFFTRTRTYDKTLPVGVILTLASAGSETSANCVIRNEDENTKRSLLSDVVRPAFAIINPELAFGVNSYTLACGITDTIMHTLDRYFSHPGDTQLTDRISEGVLTTTMHVAKVLMDTPADYPAMANLFWASALSHNSLTEVGKVRDFSVHAMERGISGSFDTAHPASLAMLWPVWARYVYQKDVQRFAQFAVNVMGVTGDETNPEATALAGIVAMEGFFKTIGMPSNFAELGVTPTDEQITEIAHFAHLASPEIGTFYVLTPTDTIHILNACR